MKTYPRLLIVASALLLFWLTPAVTKADTVTFTYTIGGCAPNTACNNADFLFTPTPGTATVSNNGTFRIGTVTFLHTGNSLAPGDFYSSGFFSLPTITFSTPVGLSPSSFSFGNRFDAYGSAFGGPTLANVVSGTRSFTFSNPQQSGSFSLNVIANSTPLNPDTFTDLDIFLQVTDLQVTNTATPEPATMLLLGTGLAGVAARLRKRRKASRKEDMSVGDEEGG